MGGSHSQAFAVTRFAGRRAGTRFTPPASRRSPHRNRHRVRICRHATRTVCSGRDCETNAAAVTVDKEHRCSFGSGLLGLRCIVRPTQSPKSPSVGHSEQRAAQFLRTVARDARLA